MESIVFWFLIFGGSVVLYDLVNRFFTHRERMVKLQSQLEEKKLLAAQAQIEAANKTLEVTDFELQQRIAKLERS